jgi:type I restriction enzyme, S subunit
MESQIVKFGDVVRPIQETENEPLNAGLERYVGVGDIEPEDLHLRSWGLIADGTSFNRVFRKGQVLFARRRAYQRKVAVAEWDGLCSGDLMVFEPKKDRQGNVRLLPELLPFVVQSEPFFQYVLDNSEGSLSPRVKWKDLAQYEFALPPLEEQRQIAEILWAVDEMLEHWRKVLQLAIEHYEAAAYESFQFRNNAVHHVECQELCDEITVGIVVRPASYYVETGGVPALRSLNVFPNRFDMNEVVRISDEAHRHQSKSRLRAGDVVVVRTGRPGDAAVVPPELDDVNCIDLIVVRPGEHLSPAYLTQYLNSTRGRTQITGSTAGTAQQHFNVTSLKTLKIPLISLDEQSAIVSNLDAVRETISRTQAHIIRGQELRKALFQELLPEC